MYLTKKNKAFLSLTFGGYCFLYLSALPLMVTNNVPAGTEWVASLMLVLQGLAATSWVVINYGLRRGLLAAGMVLFLSFLIESVGVTTGFPFGQYYYTNVLVPKLFIVPVGIMFAWLMMTLSSFFMARFIVSRLFSRWSSPRLVICLSATLAMISDTQMEPVAFHVKNYWVWETTGEYYGVPISNFVAWLVISLILLTVLTRITGHENNWRTSAEKPRYSFIPLTLYLMNLILFGAVNFSHAYYGAGIIGLTVTVLCLYVTLNRPVMRGFHFILRTRIYHNPDFD